MSVRETYGVMGYVDAQGNSGVHYPVTQAELAAYDNTTSGLTAENVQDALDELTSRIDSIVDGNEVSY